MPPVHEHLVGVVPVHLRMVRQPGREVVLDHVDRLAAGRRDPVEALVAGGHLEERAARPPPLLGGLGEKGANHRLDLLRGVLDLSVRPPVDDPDVADARSLRNVYLVVGVSDHGPGGERPEVDERDHAGGAPGRGRRVRSVRFLRCGGGRLRAGSGCRTGCRGKCRGGAGGRRLPGVQHGLEHLARVMHLPAVGVEVYDDGPKPARPRVGEGAREVARLEPVDHALDADVPHRPGHRRCVRRVRRRALRRLVGAPARGQGREGERGQPGEEPRSPSRRASRPGSLRRGRILPHHARSPAVFRVRRAAGFGSPPETARQRS